MERWQLDGVLHRSNGPALTDENTIYWYRNGREQSIVVDFLDLDPTCFSFLDRQFVRNHRDESRIPVRYNGRLLRVTMSGMLSISGMLPICPQYPSPYTLLQLRPTYTQKAKELDDYFIQVSHENAILWGIGVPERPIPYKAIAGYDEHGLCGWWHRFANCMYTINRTSGCYERAYIQCPPYMQFRVCSGIIIGRNNIVDIVTQWDYIGMCPGGPRLDPKIVEVTSNALNGCAEPIDYMDYFDDYAGWGRNETLFA